jgi:hypothetical protein
MRLASRATLKVYEAVFRALQPGMTKNTVSELDLDQAYHRVGFPGEASVQVDQYTALPHGSIQPQVIKDGSIVMLDDGCSVEGYQSDITRTFVVGKATDKMNKVFDIVKAGSKRDAQSRPSGCAARTAGRRRAHDHRRCGYGPGYQYFLHRVGHGMGMDGHEWPYLVKNNMFGWEKVMTLQPGNGLQRRAGDLHPWSVRRAARRRPARHQRWCGAVHASVRVVGEAILIEGGRVFGLRAKRFGGRRSLGGGWLDPTWVISRSGRPPGLKTRPTRHFTQVTSDQIFGTFTFSIDTGFRSAWARNAGRSRSDLKPM